MSCQPRTAPLQVMTNVERRAIRLFSMLMRTNVHTYKDVLFTERYGEKILEAEKRKIGEEAIFLVLKYQAFFLQHYI